MNTRIELIDLVPIHGTFVEIGTLTGQFACEIKAKRPDIKLFCVDNWEAPFEKDEEVARRNLQDVAYIHKANSSEAAHDYKDETFDMVYIDGDHRYAGCLADLEAWWSKVKRGGYLAGHDYEQKGPSLGWHTPIEVLDAVTDWVEGKNLEVKIVQENAPSFYIRKP